MMVDERKTFEMSDLAGLVRALRTIGEPRGPVHDVTCDSREVEPGVLFVAVRGSRVDGHSFLRQAADRGAVAAIVEEAFPGIAALPQLVVRDSRKALGLAASSIHGDPTSRIPLLGVIGTNGKTTVVYLLQSILQSAGFNCGLFGTIEYRWNQTVIPAINTTPGADRINRYLSRMIDAGVEVAVAEVSSHAVSMERVAGLRFAALALTNVTRDHLDYHGSPEAYRAVKERLFRGESRRESDVEVGVSILNLDDPVGRDLAFSIEDPAVTFGFDRAADIRGTLLRSDAAGLRIQIEYDGERTIAFLPLPGDFNGSNALAAAALALQLGVDLAQVGAGLSETPQVAGRMERVDLGQPFTVIVDYAHTPDGLLSVLKAVRPLTKGKVVCLFGCGGDRDRGKRSEMGKIAGEGADFCLLTDDNPRSEDPAEIRRGVETGLRESGAAYEVVADRREAIGRAIELAGAGDTVVIAGKGHERVQILGEKKIPFLDRLVAEEFLAKRGRGK